MTKIGSRLSPSSIIRCQSFECTCPQDCGSPETSARSPADRLLTRWPLVLAPLRGWLHRSCYTCMVGPLVHVIRPPKPKPAEHAYDAAPKPTAKPKLPGIPERFALSGCWMQYNQLPYHIVYFIRGGNVNLLPSRRRTTVTIIAECHLLI